MLTKRTIKANALLYSLFLLFVSGCSGTNPQPGSELPDFEFTWQSAARSYSHFELKGIDWDEVRQDLLPRAQKPTRNEMNAILVDLLAELKDPHVWLRVGGRTFKPYRSVRSERDDGAFSIDVVEASMAGTLQSRADGRLRYGMLDGNIGYIFFSNFSKKVQNAFF